MIIYIETIEQFIKDSTNPNILVSKITNKLKIKMQRGVSESEKRSWRTTLSDLAKKINILRFKDKQYILLEFKVPLTQKRIDVILIGQNGTKKNLLIIELKGWSRSYLTDVNGYLRIDANYGSYLSHPSQEAYDYHYHLTNQFNQLNEHLDNLKAVSLLPNYKNKESDPLYDEQFDNILKKIFTYTMINIDDFKKYISKMFNDPIDYGSINLIAK